MELLEMVKLVKPVTMKVWKTGPSFVVTIPKALVEGLNIEKGDQLRIEIMEVRKNVVNSRSKGKGKPK